MYSVEDHYYVLMELITRDDSEALDIALKDYKGELDEHEQKLCSWSIELLGNGRNSNVLRALVGAGINCISDDRYGLCPLDELLELHVMVSRKRAPEIRADIVWVLETQYFTKQVEIKHNVEHRITLLKDIASTYCPGKELPDFCSKKTKPNKKIVPHI